MGSSSSTSCSEGLGEDKRGVIGGHVAPGRVSSQLPRKPEKSGWLCWDLGSSSWEGPRGGEAASRDLASPLFSQDAHGEGCQCSHCLHFFCVGPWHPGHPGLRTGGQALHAGPIFTWDKKLSQKGLGKTSPSPLKLILRPNTAGQGPKSTGRVPGVRLALTCLYPQYLMPSLA